jgi:hypothetical protein
MICPSCSVDTMSQANSINIRLILNGTDRFRFNSQPEHGQKSSAYAGRSRTKKPCHVISKDCFVTCDLLWMKFSCAICSCGRRRKQSIRRLLDRPAAIRSQIPVNLLPLASHPCSWGHFSARFPGPGQAGKRAEVDKVG